MYHTYTLFVFHHFFATSILLTHTLRMNASLYTSSKTNGLLLIIVMKYAIDENESKVSIKMFARGEYRKPFRQFSFRCFQVLFIFVPIDIAYG